MEGNSQQQQQQQQLMCFLEAIGERKVGRKLYCFSLPLIPSLQDLKMELVHSQLSDGETQGHWGLSLLWEVNTSKCVDASPLIVMTMPTQANSCDETEMGLDKEMEHCQHH